MAPISGCGVFAWDVSEDIDLVEDAECPACSDISALEIFAPAVLLTCADSLRLSVDDVLMLVEAEVDALRLTNSCAEWLKETPLLKELELLKDSPGPLAPLRTSDWTPEVPLAEDVELLVDPAIDAPLLKDLEMSDESFADAVVPDLSAAPVLAPLTPLRTSAWTPDVLLEEDVELPVDPAIDAPLLNDLEMPDDAVADVVRPDLSVEPVPGPLAPLRTSDWTPELLLDAVLTVDCEDGELLPDLRLELSDTPAPDLPLCFSAITISLSYFVYS